MDAFDLEITFEMACLYFEQIHGYRADNDFRNTPPDPTGPAIIKRDAARAASLGGKENGEDYQPCVAPSVENARIGASLL